MKYPGVTGEKLTAAQTHIKDLARKIDANVKVGAIDIVGILKPAEWMARNLDFYACDIYDNKHCNATPYSMMGKFKDQCDKLMDSGSATIGVTETSSRCSVRRPFWFQTVWSWLETRGFTSNSSCFLTYWNPTGPESGPWLPHDKATIKTLNTIFKHSSP